MRAIVPLARVANTFVSGAIRRFVRPKQVANCSYAGQRTRAFSGTRADALDGDPDHLLLSLVREKVAVKAIAEKLGLSEGAVHRKVARLVSAGKVSAPAQHDSGDSLLDVDEDASTFVLRKSCEGRVVLNHSTHCDDLIPALEKLAEYEGIKTITPGRLKRVGGHVGFLNLKVAAAKCSGWVPAFNACSGFSRTHCTNHRSMAALWDILTPRPGELQAQCTAVEPPDEAAVKSTEGRADSHCSNARGGPCHTATIRHVVRDRREWAALGSAPSSTAAFTASQSLSSMPASNLC